VTAEHAPRLEFISKRLKDLMADLGKGARALEAAHTIYRDIVEIRKVSDTWGATLRQENTKHEFSASIDVDKSGISTGGDIKIRGIDIMEFPQALTELALYRNRRFRLNGNDVLTASAFVYTMDGIKAGEPVTPRITSVDLLQPTSSAALKGQVRAILNAVFPQANGVSYDLDVSYLPQATSIGPVAQDGIPNLPRTVDGRPSAFALPGVPIARFAGLVRLDSDDVEPVSETVANWFTQQGVSIKPGAGSDARLRFAVTVYRSAAGLGGAVGGAVPVLRIERIELPLRLLS
jgi:hypothetical protein